jgi:RNA polymerase sigma-70 factor (ECF subfamily)
MGEDARRSAEGAARASYGRLLAYLAAWSRDVSLAEDALADAFRLALETWPDRGVPDRPEAWLLTVARRQIGHAAKRRRMRAGLVAELERAADEAQDAADSARDERDMLPDKRLELLFVCAHPAIEPAARTPLMLQTVLGLDAARIASAFLTSPAAMGQRLVRAKARNREAGAPFERPDAQSWAARLEDVLAAVYAAFGAGWDSALDADPRGRGLAEEALYLGRLLAGLLPNEPEAAGLLALMLHCGARRAARRSPAGAFVPLSEQDPALWSAPMIAEAERVLARAARLGRPGRYQLEAAIQSVHAQRAVTGATRWDALCVLYDGLAALAPTVGVLVGRAAAQGEHAGPDVGLAQLDACAAEARDYQPYWAVRAHLMARAGRTAQAREAFVRAAGLSEDASVRAFLMERRDALERGPGRKAPRAG